MKIISGIKKLIQMSRDGWLKFSHDVEKAERRYQEDVEKAERGREAGRGGDLLTYRESETALHMRENALEWFVRPAQLRQLADYLQDEWKKPSANVPGWIFRSKHSLIELHVHYDQYGERGFAEILKKAIEPE